MAAAGRGRAFDGRVRLRWIAPDNDGDGGAYIGDEVIQYRESSSSTWLDFVKPEINNDPAGVSVTGLTNGTSYDFRVAATNSVGVGDFAGPITAVPAVPVQPAWTVSLTSSSADEVVRRGSLPSLAATASHVLEDYQAALIIVDLEARQLRSFRDARLVTVTRAGPAPGRTGRYQAYVVPIEYGAATYDGPIPPASWFARSEVVTHTAIPLSVEISTTGSDSYWPMDVTLDQSPEDFTVVLAKRNNGGSWDAVGSCGASTATGCQTCMWTYAGFRCTLVALTSTNLNRWQAVVFPLLGQSLPTRWTTLPTSAWQATPIFFTPTQPATTTTSPAETRGGGSASENCPQVCVGEIVKTCG